MNFSKLSLSFYGSYLNLRIRPQLILHFPDPWILCSVIWLHSLPVWHSFYQWLLGGVIIFIRQGLFFSKLYISCLSSLEPYPDYVGVNISLNNFSSLSFLNVYAPPIRSSSTNSKTDSFLPSIIPSSRNLFILGDFNCYQPLWYSKDISDPMGRKYLIGSSPLAPFLSIAQTSRLFSIASMSVALLLTSSLHPPLSCF